MGGGGVFKSDVIKCDTKKSHGVEKNCVPFFVWKFSNFFLSKWWRYVWGVGAGGRGGSAKITKLGHRGGMIKSLPFSDYFISGQSLNKHS